MLTRASIAVLFATCLAGPQTSRPAEVGRPNIIFIMADDLGWADLGCYGQEKIKTPHLDRMAAEGIRFTQAYCGTSVCAPSRCSLMTGQHMGHAQIRANRGGQGIDGDLPLTAGTLTVARLLQQSGYRTACIGKWGLGGPRSVGAPHTQGFDYFFGYTGHGQAHEYYPDHLWRNDQRVDLGGKAYSHDLIAEESRKWIQENRNRPFFLYLPFTIPHASLQVPDLGPYANENWRLDAKLMAAMITRMDGDVGRLFELLRSLDIDKQTIVFFAGDNGPDRGGVRDFFNASGLLRGGKRGMYEGGLRVPMIVRWPGRAPAGKVSDEPWAFWDVLPTCAELAGATIPAKAEVDGISIVPALVGRAMPTRDYFYWEIHEPWSSRALRFGNVKAVRPSWNAPTEIYDLKVDPYEQHDLAKEKADLVGKAEALFGTARVDSPVWPIIEPVAKSPVFGAQPLPPVVGAIRWDAWHGDKDTPGRAVEKSLGPKQWHDRLPFFARVLEENRVEVRGDTQAIIDQEIEYAAKAGLDYWAFCYYPKSKPLNYGLELYLSSEQKERIRFCLLLQSGHLGTAEKWPAMTERLVGFFKQPTYQKVLDNRPLMYLFVNGSQEFSKKFGTVEATRRAFEGLRDATRAAGLGNPYLVMLSWTPKTAAEDTRRLGFDAISAYATTGGGKGNQPYAALANHCLRFWEQCRATGSRVVPLVMAGWDRRPRVQNPVPWEKPEAGETVESVLHYTTPKPSELAGLLRDAVIWTRNYPQANPAQTILIYAWNELDEGGWLVPTLSESDARLRAIGQALGRSAPRTASSRPAKASAPK